MPDHLNRGASPAPATAPVTNRRPAGASEPATTRHLNFFTITLIVVIGLILALPIALPGRVQLALAQPAPTDIYAPQYFRYESDVLTTQDREKARQAAGPVYDYN